MAQPTLKETFYRYAMVGQGSHDFDSKTIGVESRQFAKLTRDAGLLDYLEPQDIDLIFIKSKSKGKLQRRLQFQEFRGAIGLLATKLGMTRKEFEKHINETTVNGPSNNKGTVPMDNKLYDDVEGYTGVYKEGGPVYYHRNDSGLGTQLDRNFRQEKTLVQQIQREESGRTSSPDFKNSAANRRGMFSVGGVSPGASMDKRNFAVSVVPVGQEHRHFVQAELQQTMNTATSTEKGGANMGSYLSPTKGRLVPHPVGIDGSDRVSLHDVFVMYCSTNSQNPASPYAVHSIGAPKEEYVEVSTGSSQKKIVPLMDSLRFAKLCRDAELMEEKGVAGLKYEDIDLIFIKAKSEHPTKYQGFGRVGNAAARKLDWKAFKSAVIKIAAKLGLETKEVERYLIRVLREGPKNNGGCVTEPNRFHDDPSTYTGVYRYGGPTYYEMERQGLSVILDRNYKRDKNLRTVKGDTILATTKRETKAVEADEALLQKVRNRIYLGDSEDQDEGGVAKGDDQFQSAFDPQPTRRPKKVDEDEKEHESEPATETFVSEHAIHTHSTAEPELEAQAQSVPLSQLHSDKPVPFGMSSASAGQRLHARQMEHQLGIENDIRNLTPGNGEQTADVDGRSMLTASQLDDPSPNMMFKKPPGPMKDMPSVPLSSNTQLDEGSLPPAPPQQEQDAQARLPPNPETMSVQERLVYIFSDYSGSPYGSIDNASFVDMMRRCGLLDTTMGKDGTGLRASDMATLFMKSCRSASFGMARMALDDFLMVAVPSVCNAMKASRENLSVFMIQQYLTSSRIGL